MGGLYLLLPTLLVVFVSFLIIRAAAIALMMTGLDEKRAKFQALSAFSGTGFTTREAESVVNQPKRRRIVTLLMIMGNAGIVTVIVTGTSSLVTSRGYELSFAIVLFLAGLFLIYKIVTHKGFVRRWESFIEDKFVESRIFEETATEDLLHIIEGYGLIRVMITEKSSLAGSSLAQQKLPEKEILVLGIERGKSWIPIPKARERIQNGDKLVVYGSLAILKNLFSE
jgi:hypothetical protein